MNRKPPLLIEVMTRRQKLFFYTLFFLLLGFTVYFWVWWLNPNHLVGKIGFALNSALIAWNMLMPVYFFFFAAKMKKPNPQLAVSDGLKVAMIVTKVQSESFEIVKKTLSAMLSQKYPHDTWLADEDPTEEVIAWCRQNKVFVSTRKGVAEYHRDTWPRKKKCKEGNLAYFYDQWGYDKYDFVAQMDADHVPEIGYLEEMLRPFADPKVGYVSAPSICDANADKSWVARARLYAEATLHGPLQAGYNAGWAPLCIGSHYAVRTKALKEIGGLGPELAEDFSTSLLMNAYKWKGVHALDAHAHGDGPLTFTDFATQEYQWSKSLATILFTLTNKYWVKLKFKLKIQFMFLQLFYPLYGFSMLFAYLTPASAIISGVPLANVGYIEFLLHLLPLSLISLALIGLIIKNRFTRPQNYSIFSWELFMFHFIRWPWVVLGTSAAFFGVLKNRQNEIRITPKGYIANEKLPFKIVFPYLAISLISALVAILPLNHTYIKGYYYFALLNSTFYLIVLSIIFTTFLRQRDKLYVRK
ncbi:hypothetical protein A3D00_00460 [Candidatus Woesebacteria bacterium RIFCSPHIGHO2_02_FULL_38_9]|uniref:Glycosyltransferase 2-like domain-containing protein n=1 Tax=Candidatus Woesebacteria bacterium RIFCSPHIGHO2_01_FULL_39_28 TaxID=1802496 RepID=A0A1F7YK89_9BACT|nr:MAG: hypothetical protein A2627_04710 [Candidatus Woesebacteria bacterium RIFCSPHIGHO2_01_FULL_39_28]OGM33203.1 MAG: hypothetical protein A3D00_00460 [Candidatus Woesebacteria bacterium RIFCSPHIGHO2_02_FULL_38_9]OGM57092.1 MAG: hypothetical protein A3A50_05515 [Candidatus Woesebacteria bacterium RIFCSPLOWO2_01_FULL_38_20]